MPKTFVHLTLFLFVLTALSGMWMRMIPVHSYLSVPYDNILHGHSHIAILGWAFLGSFILFIALLWPKIKQKRQAIFLTITIFLISIFMFIAFIYEGYAKYSIIISTLHIFVEYWAIFFIYQQLKIQNLKNKISALFIKGALIALFISTIGPFILGYLGATGLQKTDLFDMTIYFYLHFQYNGWLFLFLIGVFFFILEAKGIHFSRRLLKSAFWIYFISLFPWYLSAILWADLGNVAYPIAAFGSIGQFIGVGLILVMIINGWKLISPVTSSLIKTCLIITLLLLFAKSTMELGLISPAVANLVFDTRNIIIGYLHLTLLGFVSLFILTQFQMIQLVDTTKKSVLYGSIIFIGGFFLNELLLFCAGLLTWTNVGPIPYITEGLLTASILILIGIMFIWFSMYKGKRTLIP